MALKTVIYFAFKFSAYCLLYKDSFSGYSDPSSLQPIAFQTEIKQSSEWTGSYWHKGGYTGTMKKI